MEINGYTLEPGGDLTYADLSRADLTSVDLRGARLSRADLRCADMHGADLRCADMHGARLGRADLTCVDLRGAELTGAALSGADMRGADMRGAIVDEHGGHWDAPCWPWLVGHRYDAEMRTPGVVRIGCTAMRIDEWLGCAGQRMAEREGCLGTFEHRTLLAWLEMLRDTDPAELGWRPGR